MPKFLLIDIKTNLVKLYMGILILLFGGMFILVYLILIMRELHNTLS